MQVGIAGCTPLALDAAKRWLAAGLEVVVWDRDPEQAARFPVTGDGPTAVAATSIPDFVSRLAPLRKVFLFGHQPQEAEATVRGLAAQLEVSDIVVDASTCPFEQADWRMGLLAQPRARYVGMGMLSPNPDSFAGATLILGGHKVGAEAIEPLLAALVPKPRMAYLGTGGTAQLVVSLLDAVVGLEASLFAELIRLCQVLEGKTVDELASSLSSWVQQSSDAPILGALTSALKSGAKPGPSVQAESHLRTSLCTAAQTVVGLHAPVPAFLVGHVVSGLVIQDKERDTNVSRYPRPTRQAPTNGETTPLWEEARQAFAGCRLLLGIQVVQVLRSVSERLAYGIHVVDTMRLVRGSSLLQSQAFEPLLTALSDPHGSNLFVYPRVQFVLAPLIAPLRKIVAAGVLCGTPVPVCSACLCYFDSMTVPPSGTFSAASLLEILRASLGADAAGPGKHSKG